jgi:hypothetical protein
MIKVIEGMPSGTIGLEAVGKVTEEDYRDVLLPAVSASVQRNEVRLLYILGDDFDSYSPGAMWADTKLWAQHPKAWKESLSSPTPIGWSTASRLSAGSYPVRSRCSTPTTSTMPKNGWWGWTRMTTE